MNLQVTQLKVETVTPAVIEWNVAEIKASLNQALEEYRKTVVTSETLAGSKKTMAELNKQVKEIADFRKKTVGILNPNIKQFESEAKELEVMIKDARTFISDQTKTFEIEEKERKRQIALLLIEQTTNEIELNAKYIDMVELKDEYLLVASNKTKVKKLIVEQFKAIKLLQDAEQMKIDTINMVIGAHNARLRFKFSFEDFERHINDETSLTELNQIVNDKVNKRLADEQAELERIELEKKEAIAKAEEEVKRKAREEATRVAQEEEDRHQAELERVEKEKKEALWRVEFEKSQAKEALELEQRMAAQAAKETLAKVELEKQQALEAAEAKEKEAVRVAQEAQAKVIEDARLEAERLAPKVSKQKAKTVVLEIKGNKYQLDALKAYMDEYNIEYKKVEV